jgi:kynurenine formamidase
MDRRIRLLTRRVDTLEVVDPKSQDPDEVLFGATVTVRSDEEGERIYQIVGVDESNPALGKVSWISPIAKTLNHARVGDVITFKRPKGDWYILQKWTISSHIGTHIESPHHHLKDGYDVSGLPLERVFGEAVLLDFRGKEAGEEIDIQETGDLDRHVKAGDIVVIQTGFDRFYNSPDYDRPHLSMSSIEWLVQREIACLGIDASGIERYKAESQPGHLMLFNAGIPIIEELTHLEKLTGDRFFFIGLPLPIHGADSCPIRAVGLEED